MSVDAHPNSTAVRGAATLRLRNVRVRGQREPLDLDITAGTLTFLPLEQSVADELLHVLAGTRDALAGEAVTLNGRIVLTTPGHAQAIALEDPSGLLVGPIGSSAVLGLMNPAAWSEQDPGRAQALAERLAFLTLVEGRTFIGSGAPLQHN